MKPLQTLPQVTDELLGGLHADAVLYQRILSAATPSHRPPRPLHLRTVSLCAAALVLTLGATSLWRGLQKPGKPVHDSLLIDKHAAAGEPSSVPDLRSSLIDVPDGSIDISNVRSAPKFQSIFSGGSNGNFPLIGYNGHAYRMLNTSISNSVVGSSLGTVSLYTEEPALADSSDWYGLLSNAASEGTEVYAVSGLSTDTAVSASVNGNMALFQRASYSGFGAGGGSLENVLDVRGQVASLSLSDYGTVSDSGKANELIGLLLDNASYQNDDPVRGQHALHIRLNSGLTLQLLVSKNNFFACGTWSCPDFIPAFEQAMDQ